MSLFLQMVDDGLWELDIKDIKTDIDIKKTFVHENKHKVDGEEQAVERIRLKKKKKLKEHCCLHKNNCKLLFIN